MLIPVLGGLLVLLMYAPSLWVRWVMYRHGKELSELPGTGGELAEHLLTRFDMDQCVVEETDRGDHYAPADKAVRLAPERFHGRSLTAVAVAAHEVGHAIQHHRAEKIFQLRSRYLPFAGLMRRLGVMLLFAAPFLFLVVKAPAVMFLVIGLGVLMQIIGALSYLVVLPEEWDASFNKALPILTEGDYVADDQLDAVRQVLKAAALTYFAAALADVVNIGRWLSVLLRR